MWSSVRSSLSIPRVGAHVDSTMHALCPLPPDAHTKSPPTLCSHADCSLYMPWNITCASMAYMGEQPLPNGWSMEDIGLFADSCAYCMHYKNSTSNGWSSRAIVDASFGHTSNTPEVHSALNRSNWMCAWGRPGSA